MKPEPIMAAYFGNVRSILKYGCVIWGGAAKHISIGWTASNTSFSSGSSHMYIQLIPHPSLSYPDLDLLNLPCFLAQRRVQYDIPTVRVQNFNRADRLIIPSPKLFLANTNPSYPLSITHGNARSIRQGGHSQTSGEHADVKKVFQTLSGDKQTQMFHHNTVKQESRIPTRFSVKSSLMLNK